MNLNLTCQKTHILAWVNGDNTLTLKINGVKYFSLPRQDKRGERYWKLDSLIEVSSKATPTSTLSKRELTLLAAYEEKVKAGKKMEEFSKNEIDAYSKWLEEQEKVKLSSLSEERLKNHESISP